uniref:Lipoyl-binding domain-containing protein n=1 Tax=Mucochytrium quahogii TaxID=96639 RepID=A0A7S2RNR8_9STRA|mmetsp:Transcript_13904/g.22700  ORF Transcript_13904/g.22700 Transcript_13904/m.22700 type:complete len:240 (+) Transcript_13904:84-803(+)|eukprot:CAMPEP_0203749454 /NCGR_PEP_ID=MMETSP0098-20131031/4022_1 /ASSEMBLY_ACC=CAM_ASM_000208 /TAXON_ID=96639 /ORGANISM=" , Strain NY0313808BC1" /LENGTH=239 /DNA_ID=CAMNT_0050638525 /DNA_START=80 /DNA_END=799 /DNA_ORIENTATION=+
MFGRIFSRGLINKACIPRPSVSVGQAHRVAAESARAVLGSISYGGRVQRGFKSSAVLMDKFTVAVPHMGEAVTQGVVVEWLKSPGDGVGMDEVFCVLETDKVTVDIRSPQAGVMLSQLAAIDDTVNTDQPIAEFEESDGSAAPVVSEAAASPVVPDSTAEAPQVSESAVPQVVNPTVPAHTPRIRFRYGKRPQVEEAVVSDDSVAASVEYVHLAPIYGRLPALSEEEMMRVDLGGAEPY